MRPADPIQISKAMLCWLVQEAFAFKGSGIDPQVGFWKQKLTRVPGTHA